MNTMDNDTTPDPRRARTRTVRRVRLDQLWPHPLLAMLLDPPPEEKIEQLAESTRKGQQPTGLIVFDPDGYVLFGAPLVEAARLAGLTDLEVTTRPDMAGMSELEKELELIDLHLEHGGLGDFAKARFLARAHGIRDEVPAARWRAYQRGKLENVVGQYLGVHPRSAARYIHVAALPRPIRLAFEAGKIRIGQAEKVSWLSRDTLKTIADAITRGDDPATVVANHVRPVRPKDKPFCAKLDDFVSRLTEALGDLPELGGQVVFLTTDQQGVLRQVRDTLTQFLEGCQTVDKMQQRANRESLRRFLTGQTGRTKPRPGPNVPSIDGPSAGGDA
jgi:ParB-like chromosome segregation protein Spo0J